MKKGILDNKNSRNQSLLFIRDLNCIDNIMREEKAAFYNKNESENEELNFLKKLKVTKSTRKLKIYSMPRLVQIQRELSIRAVGYEHKSLKSSTTLKNSLTTQLDHQHVYDSIRLRYYDFPNTTLTTATKLYPFLSRKSLRFVRSRANQLIGLGSNLVSS